MPSRRFRAVVAAGALLSFALLLLLPVSRLRHSGPAAIDDFASGVAALAAGVACYWQAGRRRPDQAGAWRNLGIACLLWAGTQMSRSLYEVWLGHGPHYPSPVDLGHLLAAPFAVAALVGMSGVSRRRQSPSRGALDALLVVGVLVFVSWKTMLELNTDPAAHSWANRAFASMHPLADVAIVTVALLAIARVGRGQRAGVALIGAGLLGISVSDWTLVRFGLNGEYAGSIWGVVGFVGFWLILLAALRTGPAVALTGDEIPGRMGLLLSYLPLAGAVGAAVIRHRGADPIGSFLFWEGFFLVALVLVRQVMTLFVNEELGRAPTTLTHAAAPYVNAAEYQAYYDPLTGLPNRVRFEEVVNAALAQRTSRPVIMMLIDLDGFSEINDSLGSGVGDQLLRSVGDRLRLSVRADDVVARLPGDEFALLLCRNANLAESTKVAARILDSLRRPVVIGSVTVEVRGSIGLVLAGPLDDFEAVLRRAEAALGEAKRAGRDTFVVCDAISARS